MSTERDDTAYGEGNRPDGDGTGTVDRAQYVLAAVLALVGIYTIVDARGLNVGFGDPVGPRAFPFVIGGAMVALAVWLAVATARGGRRRGRGRGGRRPHLSAGLAHRRQARRHPRAQPAPGEHSRMGDHGLLFAGCAWALGSKTLLRDLIVGAVLSVASWYFFYVGLGVPLPPGILDGIL